MIAESGPFSRRAVTWIAAVCTVSLLGGAVLGALGDDIAAPRSHGSDGFSYSALGHAGFREVLSHLGVPVVLSRHASGRRAAAGGVLLVAEPNSRDGLKTMIETARSTLLVLPKWRSEPHEFAPGWIRIVTPVPETEVNDVLADAGVVARLARPRSVEGGWTGAPGGGPVLQFPQLLEGEGLEALIRCREGILLAEVPHPLGEGRRLRILSDPDLLANHGLGRGDNAAIVVAAIEDLRGGSGTVFIDETLHGFARTPSFWRESLSFPLALVTMHALLLAGLVVLAGGARFGAAAHVEAAPGKAFLVENTARLLALGGHSSAVLVRYWRDSLRAVAETLRAPGSPGSTVCLDALDRASRSRGLVDGARSLDAKVLEAARGKRRDGGRTLLRAAAEVRSWREEMTRGH